MSEFFKLYSDKHSRGICLWWRAESRGYTSDPREAGTYTREEVAKILHGCHYKGVTPVPVIAFSMLEIDHHIDTGRQFNAVIMDEARKGIEQFRNQNPQPQEP